MIQRLVELEERNMKMTAQILDLVQRLAGLMDRSLGLIQRLSEMEERHMQVTDKVLEISQRLMELEEKHMELTQRVLEGQERLFSEVRWLRGALLDIKDALGGGFEYYTANAVRAILRERGFDCEVLVNVTLPIDGYKEVDIFCPDPLVVGEVTVALRSIEEANKELEKLNASVAAAEKFTGKRHT